MIETNFENGIYQIVLNRPEKRNAFNAEMILRITDAVQSLPDTARAVQFMGNGKSFCAGADLNYMHEQAAFSDEENYADAKKLSHMFEMIYQLPIPTMVYAHGNVFGGGLGILAACDITIAEENTKFCFSEVKLGLIPALISPYVLRKTGVAFAKRYFMTAEIFSAATAKSARLISETVSESDAKKSIQTTIEHLQAAGLDAQKSVKRLIYSFEKLEPMSRDQLILEIAKLRSSDDAQLRMQQFLQKKP